MSDMATFTMDIDIAASCPWRRLAPPRDRLVIRKKNNYCGIEAGWELEWGCA